MDIARKIKEAKVGMFVQVTKRSCPNCFHIDKYETDGTIIEVDANGKEFKIKDWADREFYGCVNCCVEVVDE